VARSESTRFPESLKAVGAALIEGFLGEKSSVSRPALLKNGATRS